jgi:hypothetical protein
VDAQHLQILAAVDAAAPASKAFLAIDIRLHGAVIAGLDIRHTRTDLLDHDAQLMAGNAGIAEKRHFAEVPADVSAANADPMDAHQRLTWARPGRRVDLDRLEVTGLHQTDRFHETAYTLFN